MLQRSGVHPTALVADGADLGEGVVLGPGCIVGPRVRLGDGCRLRAYVVVEGDTVLGPGCDVYPFAVIGGRPQDKKLRLNGEGRAKDAAWTDEDGQWSGRLRIGAHNEIREHVTLHGGTPFGSGETRIGDRNMFLAGSHVGHDATVGNDVVFTNGAMAAGHSEIQDFAVIGAMSGVHQFTRVGRGAMVGAGAMVSHDAPPFGLVQGDRARLVGVNRIGLRRMGYSVEQAARIKRVFRLLFWRDGVLEERIANARAFAEGDELAQSVIDFVATSERGVCTPRGRTFGSPTDDPEEL